MSGASALTGLSFCQVHKFDGEVGKDGLLPSPAGMVVFFFGYLQLDVTGGEGRGQCIPRVEALRRGHRCDASVFDGEVLCISLPSCKSRRRHTEKELTCWGFPLPRFVEALGPNDEEVLRWFNSPSLGGKSENVSCFLSLRVAKFPPCFRCGLVTDCCCANNDMLLEQVANWLSFRKAWTEIANSTKEWHLLVEDDVKFTHKAAECWNELVTPELLQENTGTAWASSAGSLTAVGIQRVPELRNPGACQLADLALETCDENE
eukprot:s444_g17.t1